MEALAAGGFSALPAALARRFEALIFDWDGTAVLDRTAPAGRVRRLVETLSERGLDLAVVSGTNVANVDGQLAARPIGPGRLFLCLNRGSEVFEVGPAGARLLHRRLATPEEEAALTAAADATASQLRAAGLEVAIVADRLNRRKIDLIPEPEWADPPKARIGELLDAVLARLAGAGLDTVAEVVALAAAAARDAGLADPRVTSDVKHVEIGLTDKSDSARWALADLWRRGISPGEVLVAGDEFGPLGGVPGSDSLMLVVEQAGRVTAVSVGAEPLGVPSGVIAIGGGPLAFAALLEDQLARRERRELPIPDPDPTWTVAVDGFDLELERAHESLLTIADGRIGTRGSPLDEHRATTPAVVAAGVYAGDGPEETLLPCPRWNHLPVDLSGMVRLRRTLDLRTGLLRHELELDGSPRVNAVLFSSLARPGTTALRAQGAPELVRDRAPLVPPREEPVTAEEGDVGAYRWMRVHGNGGGVAAAARDTRTAEPGPRHESLERLAVYRADALRPPAPSDALAALVQVEHLGFERLLREHRAAWAARWEAADVVVEGDVELQRAIRFALFHLIGSVAAEGEAAVGARGLTGTGYRGHVFWDADVFVLPFLAATHPPAARAMLEYRIARLPASRAAAQAIGRAGARLAWESARSGSDVTPTHTYDVSGAVVPIRTGLLEEHIVADVAWAAACYLDWTGDEEFAAGPGLELLVETARYWASRARLDVDGRAHIYGVIGPDEYRGPVDDNAYTNVMARWNLRRAAEAGGAGGVEEEERASWLRLADALVDGYDPVSGLYEEFSGFWKLEPLVIEDVAPSRPISAEALLGLERVRAAQVVKQADVLMLHHLVPDETAPGSLEPNVDFYEPRTSHGSSLSPGIHASLLARLGRMDEALEYLRLTSRIDLDDLTQTTAGGLHVAALGSLWQALAFGFAGVRPCGRALAVDPRLPQEWDALELRLRFRGSGVRLRVERDAMVIAAEPAVRVRVPGRVRELTAPPEGVLLARHGSAWKEVHR